MNPCSVDGPSAREVLAGFPLLATLGDDVRRLVEDSFVPVSYPFGAVIVREGEPADAYYLLVAGTARVIKRNRHGDELTVNKLAAGDGFGEVALLSDGPRTATVRASNVIHALRLDGSMFVALVRNHQRLRSELERQVQHHEVCDFLAVHSVFRQLPAGVLAALSAEIRAREFHAGQHLICQGDAPSGMFIVREGRLRAFRDDEGTPVDVGFIRGGDVFGEASLVAEVPQPATVAALTDGLALELEPAACRRLLAAHAELRALIEARVRRGEYRQRARVPLDFAEQLLSGEPAAGRTRVERAGEREQEHQAASRAVASGEPEEQFVRSPRRIRRFPHVWQIDEADCGAACVAMACHHFGRRVGLARVREAVHTDARGASLAAIARGGEALGLASRAVKVSKSRLDELALPAVVHWEGDHWVVLYDADAKRARIADPACGLRRVAREEFLAKWSGYAVLLAPTDTLADQPEAETSIRWFAAFFRPHRRVLARALLLALIAAGLEMLIAVFGKVIVDQVVPNRDYGLLALVVLGMLAAIAVTIVATVAQRYMLSLAMVKIDSATLDFLARKLLALPASYFQARGTGDIERRMNGMQQVRQFIVQNGVQSLTAATQLLVAVILMFVYSAILALVFLSCAPLYAALMRFSSKRLRPMFDSLESSFANYHSRQIDAINGIETVKAMGAERALQRVLLGQFNELAHRLFRSDYTMMLYDGAIQLIAFLSLALFLWIGGLLVLHHELTIGEFVAFNALIVLANAPLVTMLAIWDRLHYSSILLGRVNDIIGQEPEQGPEHSHLRSVPTLEGRIALHSLDFHYPGAVAFPILKDINLDVKPGTSVAIVGRSGSGKTTLIKCLTGLLEPTNGSITYDGIELRTLDYRELRRQIGFVLQENHLFGDTIARNIAFGEEEPEMERVTRAAQIAAAHDFVLRLPLGYETKIGDSGLLLSGGQRQRIAIARAIYHDPSVLIFDEATSSLDNESERAVQGNMQRLLDGRTSFIVAHRLSTVRNADVIIVLDKGRIVERGTHDELIAAQALYYHLSSEQLDV